VSTTYYRKPETLKDKRTLLQEAPMIAEILLDSGCNKVFIIWDRKPRWGDGGNCETDRQTLIAELQRLNVTLDKVVLCCIDEMLESWLIADGDGVTNWIKSKTTHKIKPFVDHKAGNQQSPKEKIGSYVKQNFPKVVYNDYVHNLEILQYLPNFKKAIKWNPSFGEFANAINEICP